MSKQNLPAGKPATERIGYGPLYEPIRDAARDLVPVWVPWGMEHTQNSWAAPPLSVETLDNGKHRLRTLPALDWQKDQSPAIHCDVDLDSLRATAISLLVYCEAQE
jgi:hypothetical protein